MPETYGYTGNTTGYDYYGALKSGGVGSSSDVTDFTSGGIQGATALDSSSGNWMSPFGGYQGLQAIGGLGQLALGGLAYFENKKNAKLQRELMGQQIDTNKFLLGQAKGRQNDIARDFGGGTAPAGLAASSAQAPVARKVI